VQGHNGGFCHGYPHLLLAGKVVHNQQEAIEDFRGRFENFAESAEDDVKRALLLSLREQYFLRRSNRAGSKYEKKYVAGNGRRPNGFFGTCTGGIIDKANAPYCDAFKRAADRVATKHGLDSSKTRLVTHVQLADFNHVERLGMHADGGTRIRLSLGVASVPNSSTLKFNLLQHSLDVVGDLAELLEDAVI